MSSPATELVINGTTYVPKTGSVGVGITTHNRRETAEESIRLIRERTSGAKIVVVDDGSDVPYPDADHRFPAAVGIARAKNKCLELLDGCEHIFLFDDDCYPLKEGWERPYIESPEPHLMAVFKDLSGRRKLKDISLIYKDSRHKAWSRPRGMMLYVHHSAVEAVGGMDPIFGRWGFEHGDWSNRIYNAGLTTHRYADVVGSEELIYSMDQHLEVQRSISPGEIKELDERNRELFFERQDDSHYVEYRELKNVVLTCLLSQQPDPQRKAGMAPDPKLLADLLKSLKAHKTVVIHDSLEAEDSKQVTYHRVEGNINPYWQRWVSYFEYLRSHPEIGFVWCVDGTDVELLGDPWELENGTLYVGSEANTVAYPWLAKEHPAYKDFIADDPGRQMLNAGLVGGDRQTVMAFIHDLIREHFDRLIGLFYKRADHDTGLADMAAFNYVAHTLHNPVYGTRVNTVFKAEERNQVSIWKHK